MYYNLKLKCNKCGYVGKYEVFELSKRVFCAKCSDVVETSNITDEPLTETRNIIEEPYREGEPEYYGYSEDFAFNEVKTKEAANEDDEDDEVDEVSEESLILEEESKSEEPKHKNGKRRGKQK